MTSDDQNVGKDSSHSTQKPSQEENVTASDIRRSAVLARLGLGNTYIPGEASIDELLAELTSGSWWIRAEAAQKLGTMGEQKAIKNLVALLLNDPEPSVRATAARALGDLEDYAPIEPLVRALQDSNERVKAAAAWALGEQRGRIPIGALINILDDKDENVRTAVVRALGQSGEYAPIEILKKALQDTSWQVREMAALTLGNLEDRIPKEALRATLEDDNEFVRRAASRSLAIDSFKEDLGSSQHPGSSPTPATGDSTIIVQVMEGSQGDISATQVTQHGPLETHTSGNIEFLQLEPPDLGTVPVVPQALDNQWLPRAFLQKIVKGKQLYTNVAEEVERLVRAEYIRALINGKQVVINRAYLYNTPAIFRDYLAGHQSRESFKILLNAGVIVPFLYIERSPDEKPAYETHREGFSAWQQLCQEVRMQCLRFSWDNEANQDSAREQLSRRFHDFALTARSGNIKTYIKDLVLDPDSESELKKYLGAMARLCLDFADQDKHVTRNDLYKAFVITTGSEHNQRLYDSTKPFSAEIKQLIDLAYNSYFADAIGGYLLSPVDSLSRIVLQEWQMTAGKVNQITAKDLATMLRKDVFTLVSGGLYLKSMGLLSLQDVQDVRHMDEWEAYIQSLEGLLQHPIEFAERANQVYKNYITLAVRMTKLLEQRNKLGRQELATRWNPVAEFVIDVAGAILSVVWTEEGLSYTFRGEDSPRVTPSGLAPFKARLNIGDLSGSYIQADLFTSLEFMKGHMQDAQEQWKEIRARLKEALTIQEGIAGSVKTGGILNDKDPSMA